MVGFVYELVRECDDLTNPHSDPVLEFFRHMRNAAFHGNTFDIYPKVSTNVAKWRGRTVDRGNLNGKKLFFEFLAPGDAFLLLSDLLATAQPNVKNPVTII